MNSLRLGADEPVPPKNLINASARLSAWTSSMTSKLPKGRLVPSFPSASRVEISADMILVFTPHY